jgi:hypothetical protein
MSDDHPSRPPDSPAPASAPAPEKKLIEHYPQPEPDELPPPTFKQALIGYGSILLALVVLGLLIGLLMKVLR